MASSVEDDMPNVE
jgi:hypothetical protein